MDLGLRVRAVVLEPESLRLEIVRELQELASAYATPADGADPPAGCRGSPHPDRPRRRTSRATSLEE